MAVSISKASIDLDGFNLRANIPYGLTPQVVQRAVSDLYEILFLLNTSLLRNNYSLIEDLMLGNAFSGFMSEILVKQISVRSNTLTRNTMVGGHPDLIPRGRHPDNAVLRGDEGIEVKASRHTGGWQRHNIERGWLMVFVYRAGDVTRPTEIMEILAGQLNEADWSFSGRSETSRRTITASIRREAVARMRSNWIYRASSQRQESQL